MMKNATAKNEVQGIQKVLEEYLGNQESAKVAVEISAAMKGESQHSHMDEVFYIHKDEGGTLVLTMESVVKSKVEAILYSYLKRDDVQECLELLTKSEAKTTDVTTEFEWLEVEGSDSDIYAPLMEHKVANLREEEFINVLKEAISASVKKFKVPVCDPSLDKNGKLQFVSGFKPAVGYSYNELEKLAESNGLRLGSRLEYVLFLSTLISNLIADGWSANNAFYAICVDSKSLGHYQNSFNAKYRLELTGSRKIGGKCDLANTNKILAADKKAGCFWIAGGSYCQGSCNNSLSVLQRHKRYVNHNFNSVGWFVL